METDTFPLVALDHTAPAGKPDECFWCGVAIGKPHSRDCVIVTKKVLLKVTINFEVSVPHSWDKENIEFHRNDGSWCANNVIDEFEAEFEQEDSEECLCDKAYFEYIKTTDNTPVINMAKTKTKAEEK